MLVMCWHLTSYEYPTIKTNALDDNELVPMLNVSIYFTQKQNQPTVVSLL